MDRGRRPAPDPGARERRSAPDPYAGGPGPWAWAWAWAWARSAHAESQSHAESRAPYGDRPVRGPQAQPGARGEEGGGCGAAKEAQRLGGVHGTDRQAGVPDRAGPDVPSDRVELGTGPRLGRQLPCPRTEFRDRGGDERAQGVRFRQPRFGGPPAPAGRQ